MSCTLDSLFNCKEFSVGGVNRIWISHFGDLYNYKYESNNTGKVTAFSAYTVPTEYRIVSGSFVEDYQNGDAIKYMQKLSVIISKLDHTKRNEFTKLENARLTIIFQDNNNKYWIFGTKYYAKVSKLVANTGGDASTYTLEFEALSNFAVQEIVGFDSTCFTSFNGTITSQSLFTINDASSADLTGDWQIIKNLDLLTYSPNQPLDPTNWSTPLIYAQDAQEILNMISSPTASVQLTYDSGLDIAYILIYDIGIAYDYYAFNGNTPYRSNITSVINLYFTLSAIIDNPSTNIIVKDSDDVVVYSGAPDDVISGTGLSGTVRNAYIQVSLTYPNGTTFTAEVEGGNCEMQEYTFTLPALQDCSLGIVYGYYYGGQYRVDVPKLDTAPTYRKITVHFAGYQITMYPYPEDYHSSFATLQSDLNNWISGNINIPIQAGSFSVAQGLTAWSMRFKSELPSELFYVMIEGNDTVLTSNITNGQIGQTYLINLTTNVPSDSSIVITNTYDSNTISGQYNNSPIVNDYNTEDIPGVSNQLTNNIGIDARFMSELTDYNIAYESSACPDTTDTITPSTCFETLSITSDKKYVKLEYQAATSSELNLGTQFTVTSSNAVITNFTTSFCSLYIGLNEFVETWNTVFPNYKILQYYYRFGTGRYIIELECPSDDYVTEILSVAQGQPFVETVVYDIVDVEVMPTMNPLTNLGIEFINVYGDIFATNNYVYVPANIFKTNNENILRMYYDSGTGEIELEYLQTLFDSYTINFYNVIPTNLTVPMISYSSSVTTPVTENIQADLAALLLDVNDVTYIKLQNEEGLEIIMQWATSIYSDMDSFVFDTALYMNMWGRLGKFKVLTTDVDLFTPTYFVNSLLCPAFSPLTVGDLLLWNDASTISPSSQEYISTGITATCVFGSDTITVASTGELVIGNYIRLGSDVSAYTYYIVDIPNSTTIVLNNSFLEASNSLEIYLGKLTYWNDNSYYGRVVSQLDDAHRPRLRTNAQNGLSSLLFLADDYYEVSAPTASSVYNVFAITRESFSGSSRILYSLRDTTQPFVTFGFAGTDQVELSVMDNNTNPLSTSTSPYSSFDYDLFWWYANLDTLTPQTDLNVGINGVDGTMNSSSSLDGNFATGNETIGGEKNITYQPGFYGDVCELLIYSNLTTLQKQQVEGYLAWKWDLVDKLPLSHPYKTIQP